MIIEGRNRTCIYYTLRCSGTRRRLVEFRMSPEAGVERDFHFFSMEKREVAEASAASAVKLVKI